MATSTTASINKKNVKKSGKSSIGAPSMKNQSSRKGKKAWRKNVDIEELEEGLEEGRVEEIVSGKRLKDTKDEELFVVDVVGNDKVTKNLPQKYSKANLTSTKILQARSAIPAVYSKQNSTTSFDRKNKMASKMSKEEKERLRKLVRKSIKKKGPFGAVVDEEIRDGMNVEGVSLAVRESGRYDPWSGGKMNVDGEDEGECGEEGEGEEGEGEEGEEEFVDPMKVVVKVRAPSAKKLREGIAIPAVVEPHHGTSYNPSVDAHQELIIQAAEMEERRLKQLEKMKAVKEKMEKARALNWSEKDEEDAVGLMRPGMKIDTIEDDMDEDEDGVKAEEKDDQVPVKNKSSTRKTTSQRNKQAKLLAEKRILAEKASTKRLLASISLAKGLRKATARKMAEQDLEVAQRKLALVDKIRRHGLSGQRLGKHKVPEEELEVQLGEDLSESLRGLKPEGNLFRDRFRSLQQRALIEPRVPVIPKKRKMRIIEYEKHAWKRFE